MKHRLYFWLHRHSVQTIALAFEEVGELVDLQGGFDDLWLLAFLSTRKCKRPNQIAVGDIQDAELFGFSSISEGTFQSILPLFLRGFCSFRRRQLRRPIGSFTIHHCHTEAGLWLPLEYTA